MESARNFMLRVLYFSAYRIFNSYLVTVSLITFHKVIILAF